MDNTIEKFEHNGVEISIWQDVSAQSPREEFDNLGTIYSNCRSVSPDNHDIDELLDAFKQTNYMSFQNYLNDKYYWIEIYGYDHSGMTIKTSTNGNPFSCKWDSGLFGIILVDKETAYKEYGKTNKTKKITLKALDTEVAIYDAYLRGEIVGYSFEKNGEVYSCGGFYGAEYAKEEAIFECDAV